MSRRSAADGETVDVVAAATADIPEGLGSKITECLIKCRDKKQAAGEPAAVRCLVADLLALPEVFRLFTEAEQKVVANALARLRA